MTQVQQREAWPEQRPARRRGPTYVLVLTVALAHTAAALLQPVLAGSYLSGDVDAIQVHSGVGTLLLPLLAMAQVVAAALFWRPGRGPGWPVLLCVAIFFAEGLQIGMGYSRSLAVHIPLGAGIVATSVVLAAWLLRWRPR